MRPETSDLDILFSRWRQKISMRQWILLACGICYACIQEGTINPIVVYKDQLIERSAK